MKVMIYVDTSKEVGDVDHLKVFVNGDAAYAWLKENDPEGVASLNRRPRRAHCRKD